VTAVSARGLTLRVDREELFLSFEHFPWFRHASAEDIRRVERPSPLHLFWPELDIDLSIESIRHPEQFPLVSR
jgi:hypothetical protein